MSYPQANTPDGAEAYQRETPHAGMVVFLDQHAAQIEACASDLLQMVEKHRRRLHRLTELFREYDARIQAAYDALGQHPEAGSTYVGLLAHQRTVAEFLTDCRNDFGLPG